MSVLVDTNVLVLRTQRRHETYATAVRSIAHLLAQDELVFFTLQNIAEFWNVATRPVASNGLGLSTAETLVEVGKIEELLTYLPDASALYEECESSYPPPAFASVLGAPQAIEHAGHTTKPLSR